MTANTVYLLVLDILNDATASNNGIQWPTGNYLLNKTFISISWKNQIRIKIIDKFFLQLKKLKNWKNLLLFLFF